MGLRPVYPMGLCARVHLLGHLVYMKRGRTVSNKKNYPMAHTPSIERGRTVSNKKNYPMAHTPSIPWY
jgi:hypothetical protein